MARKTRSPGSLATAETSVPALVPLAAMPTLARWAKGSIAYVDADAAALAVDSLGKNITYTLAAMRTTLTSDTAAMDSIDSEYTATGSNASNPTNGTVRMETILLLSVFRTNNCRRYSRESKTGCRFM
jgi:hypothetical protein